MNDNFESNIILQSPKYVGNIVLANLQILTAEKNYKKYNKFIG